MSENQAIGVIKFTRGVFLILVAGIFVPALLQIYSDNLVEFINELLGISNKMLGFYILSGLLVALTTFFFGYARDPDDALLNAFIWIVIAAISVVTSSIFEGFDLQFTLFMTYSSLVAFVFSLLGSYTKRLKLNRSQSDELSQS